MGTTRGSQSNHYETLKLAPTASNEEISQAFSAQMRGARVRPDISVVRIAQLSVAYETLRDPGRRRAYDASIGLKPELTVRLAQPPSPLGGATLLERLNRVAEAPVRAVPQLESPVIPQSPAESRVAAFIAASVREPKKRVEPEVPSRRSQAVPPNFPESATDAPSRVSTPDLVSEIGRPPIGRAGVALAAGVAGLAVLGFALVPSSRNPERLSDATPQARSAVTVALPKVTMNGGHLALSQPPVTTDPKVVVNRKAEADRPARAPAPMPLSADPAQDQPEAEQRSVQTAVNPPAAGLQETAVEFSPPGPGNSSTEAAPAVVTNAKLPLPDATIARTIERIGYACGRVVSASVVEGVDGAFKITCSSGDAYRAAPVGGRYHFRRWGDH